MITRDQLTALSKQYKTNDTVILREYIQLLFLSYLYIYPESHDLYFKGGTAIHLIFKAPRFSEDLDFTTIKVKESRLLVEKTCNELHKEIDISWKEKKVITGISYMLRLNRGIVPFDVTVKLDISTREIPATGEQSTISTGFPVVFTAFVRHLAAKELAAEKVRAIMTRKQGRDIYDLHYLLSLSAGLDKKLIKDKLQYYKLQYSGIAMLKKRVHEFSEMDFVMDMKPFVPLNDRERLPEIFRYIKSYIDTLKEVS